MIKTKTKVSGLCAPGRTWAVLAIRVYSRPSARTAYAQRTRSVSGHCSGYFNSNTC